MPSEPWTRPGVERIVLVGFMAAGKTTVGKRLAERLGWRFADFDAEVQTRTGRGPGSIIREEGEAAFRHLESVITRNFAGVRGVVLSPGGGWGADPARAAELGPGTVRVWLRITAEEAVRRAGAEGVDRPLLGAPGPERLRRAARLLADRADAYAAAEIVVDVTGRPPEAVVEEIMRKLEEGP